MADNTTLPGTGDVIASDDIGGVKYQIVKAAFGPLDTATLVSTSSPLPVSVFDVTASAALTITQAVTLTLNGHSSASFQITAIVGTVTFEASNDGGTIWDPINGTASSTSTPATTTTVTGTYRVTPGALGLVRARLSLGTSATIFGRASAGTGGIFANQILPMKVTDGVSVQAIKAVSTAAVAGDAAAVVALSPNSPLPVGTNVVGAVTQSGTWNIGSISTMPTTPVTGTFWQATQPVSLATNTPDVIDRAARLLGQVTNAGTFAVQAAATLAAETTKVIGTVNVSAGQAIAATQGTAGALANAWPVKVTDGTNVSAVEPFGALVANTGYQTLFYDEWATSPIDTTDKWTVTGTTPGVANGVMTMVATASTYNAIQTKDAVRPNVGFSLVRNGISIETAVSTGAGRFWGLGTPATVPAAAVLAQNGIGYELDQATGALLAVTYAAGVRTTIATLTRPTDGAIHAYGLYFRVTQAYWILDGVTVASQTFPNVTVAGLPALIVRQNAVAFTGTPAFANTAHLTADTSRQGTVISDPVVGTRQARVNADGSLRISGVAGGTALPVSTAQLPAALGGTTSAASLAVALSSDTASGSITTQNLVPAGAATAGSAVEIVLNGASSLAPQVTGTYTGALSLQVSVDGTNWITVGGTPLINVNTGGYLASVTSALQSIFQADCGGFTKARITALAAVTGTAVVTIRASANPSMLALDAALPTGANTIGNVTLTSGAVTTPTSSTTTSATLSSAATTNATLVKNSAANLYSVTASNVGAAAAFLKVFNLAVAPTVGTSVPFLTIPIAASGIANIQFGAQGFRMATGISFSITNLVADSDTTAVAAAQIKVSVAYI